MMTIKSMGAAEQHNAELVAESLAGDQDAFRQIVERHQTLICSLAYCATGSLSQSEDLAQQTFVTAWKQLVELREPSKLRPWLCGIARFVIGTELRRQGREPVHAAEPLEAADALIATEPQPPERAINKEEAAILWRSLERIPEIYREPLVLFYREHQSIENVAAALDLSEDAVKQRLSRGRKLLQEQVLAFVEGALEGTRPGQAFTLGVVAALPLLATAAKVTAVGATSGIAVKGSAAGKAAGLIGFLKTVLSVAPIASLGAYVGVKMSRDAGSSLPQREFIAGFWRTVVVSLALFIVLPLVLLVSLAWGGVLHSDWRPQILAGLTLWVGLMYIVVVAALGVWAWQRRRKLPPQSIDAVDPRGTKKKPFMGWVVMAMIGTGILLIALLLDTNWKVGRLSTAETRQLIAGHPEAKFSILQYQSGNRHLWIRLQENSRLSKFTAPADEATLALLAEKGIACPTYVQGRDFEILGWSGRLLPALCIFTLAAGAVLLLRWSGKKERKLPAPAE